MTSTASEVAARRAARISRIELQLDEALAATFPASDPVSLGLSQMDENGLEDELVDDS